MGKYICPNCKIKFDFFKMAKINEKPKIFRNIKSNPVCPNCGHPHNKQNQDLMGKGLNMSKKKLLEKLQALQKAGYEQVTIQQVISWLRD